MKKFKLIREYPGSPKLGTEIIKSTIYGASSTKVVHTYMIKGDETFQLNNPKDYPEFWQEVVEKDYEILNFISTENNIAQLSYFTCENNFTGNNIWKIYSIKRKSDGEIFTIGDKIFPNNKIYKFELKDNNLKIWHCDISFSTPIIEGPSGQPGNCSWIEGISNVQKIKQPLFTTEDGVDIFEDCEVYQIDNNFTVFYYISWKNYYGDNGIPKPGYKWFSTKEKAEEYILMNKPCLSINNFLKVFPKYISMSERDSIKLKELVQQKLNK